MIEYPQDSRRCWSPVAILAHIPDKAQIHVRFYDGIDDYISHNTDAIEINENKFSEYASRRIEFEQKLRGQAIVGLDEETQTYLLGTIIDRIASGHKYLIRWCNGKENTQTEDHLFGTLIRRNRCDINDRVLALDDDQYIYKPATIIKRFDDEKTLTVRFADSNGENK